MGLSIHYKGYFKEAGLLPDFIREVKDVAEIHGWEYQIFGAVFPEERFSEEMVFDKFYGIHFTPTNSETISLVFLSNGRMICPVRVKFSDRVQLEQKDSWIYTNSVKTQYAGVVVHQLIIHFFRYLNNKYFRDFEMKDESYYWETNDEEKLKIQFKIYDSLMDNFVLAIETLPLQKDEGISSYFERLMKYVNDLKNSK
ncbi:MAG: hypothetical protein H3C48_10300 [Chitinophagaceae bacterium]|nr:hypothetical protein [Chitinophagaceae bacterium]